MAAINFPSSPVNGQLYDQNGVYYTYDSTIGAWVTSVITTPYDKSINTQIIFNDSSIANGSNGMVFNKTANTTYFNNVAVTLNVSATYFHGNGALLTGVVSDFSPAFNKANAALANTTGVYFNGNLNFPSGNIAVGRTSADYAIDVVGTVNASALFVNGAALSGGATLTNEVSSSSTYYPVLTTATSGTMSTANTSNSKLYFVPSTGTLSATVFNSLSDSTLKTNVEEINGISLLNNIRPISFNWKDTGQKSYGVIAQELEQTLPELVETNDQGLKSVSYIPMIAMLIDVVKKQEERIEKLEQLLNNQK